MFSTFSESFLATNHSVILVSHCLHEKTDSVFFKGVRKIVSPANTIGSRRLEACFEITTI